MSHQPCQDGLIGLQSPLGSNFWISFQNTRWGVSLVGPMLQKISSVDNLPPGTSSLQSPGQDSQVHRVSVWCQNRWLMWSLRATTRLYPRSRIHLPPLSRTLRSRLLTHGRLCVSHVEVVILLFWKFSCYVSRSQMRFPWPLALTQSTVNMIVSFQLSGLPNLPLRVQFFVQRHRLHAVHHTLAWPASMGVALSVHELHNEDVAAPRIRVPPAFPRERG